MKIKCGLLTLFMMLLSLSVYSQEGNGGGGGGGVGAHLKRAAFRINMDVILNVNESSDIEVYFTNDIKVVDITIVNETNTVVYNATVDTSTTNYVNIDISNLVAGQYTVNAINSQKNIIKSENFVVRKE